MLFWGDADMGSDGVRNVARFFFPSPCLTRVFRHLETVEAVRECGDDNNNKKRKRQLKRGDLTEV